MKWILILFSIATIGLVASQWQKEDHSIRLRWVKAYETEDWEKVKTGLIWAFGYMGATLPSGSFDASITKTESEYVFEINLATIGFSPEALKVISPLIKEMKASEEYKTMGGIDIGRFLMYTLHSSWHYFAITDAAPSIRLFKEKNGISHPNSYELLTSGVAFKKRTITFNTPAHWHEIAFMGFETDSSAVSPPETYYETIDIMKNGQLRFGIYGADGLLDVAANPKLTAAGKPGKCQWCHEKHLQMIFYPTDDVPGSMKTFDFVRHVDDAQRMLTLYRKSLQTDITYDKTQDHAYAELLYITFLEPSAYRLANEWQIPLDKLQRTLQNFPTHTYEEYPYLGTLYARDSIASLSPYRSVRVPSSARELSAFEPKNNLIHYK